MKLWSNSFDEGDTIPGDFAFCVIDPASHVRLSGNRNPHLAWNGVPEATKSLVLVCHDPDVPSRGDDVNKEGRTVPATLPRIDFFHWVLIDISPELREIAAGQFSSGITPRGKKGPSIEGHGGMRHGLNDYTGWFANDESMAGNYFGYDGPCPPWNDSIEHHYIFTLYALDTERVSVEGAFTGKQVREAIVPYILAEAKFSGRYTLNPELA